MRGRVLGYDPATGAGIISGDDGRRYNVTQDALQGGVRSLAPGATVDFEADGGRAASVFVMPSGGLAGDKNKWVAALLAFLFGAFGVHKFYLGRQREGIIMLLCAFPGMLLVLPLIAVGIMAFVEAIIYAVKTDQDFYDQYVVGQRAWF